MAKDLRWIDDAPVVVRPRLVGIIKSLAAAGRSRGHRRDRAARPAGERQPVLTMPRLLTSALIDDEENGRAIGRGLHRKALAEEPALREAIEQDKDREYLERKKQEEQRARSDHHPKA